MPKQTTTPDNFEVNTTTAGTAVSQKIIENIINARPPVNLMPHCTQGGKSFARAYDKKNKIFKPLFPTFKFENKKWIYCGLCFLGENIEPNELKIPINEKNPDNIK